MGSGSGSAARAEAGPPSLATSRLGRVLRLPDVVLFLVVAVVGTRWIPAAAAIGPGAIALWLIAAAAFFVPLALAVVELSSRHPEEGGLYVWARAAFGDFAGFMTGWMYWASCLVYFPGLLYFVAGNLQYVAGGRVANLAPSAVLYLGATLAGLLLALLPNLFGLGLGRWLHNLGAIASWSAVTLLIVAGAASAIRFGPATPFHAAALWPSFGAREAILCAAIAFGFGGVEASSFMGDEIREARRTIPRAVLVAGAVITAIYVAGTVAILLAVPAGEVNGLLGIVQAMEHAGRRLGWSFLAPLSATLIAIGGVGMAGAWLASTARLPFVAGVDHRLPEWFGRVHPRWRVPHVALLAQAAGAALFAVLGQAGTSVRGAYEVLVSMGVITYFLPFLVLFAALIRLQRQPAAGGTRHVPGGVRGAFVLGALGFASTLVALVLALIPSPGTPHPTAAVLKVVGANAVLIAAGAWVFGASRRRAGASRNRAIGPLGS